MCEQRRVPGIYIQVYGFMWSENACTQLPMCR